MVRVRAAIVSWASLGLAGVGILIPILWDRYRDTTALEVHHNESSVLVDSVAGLEQLKITYAGDPVPRVTKADFEIANTGHRPIRAADVVAPLRLAVDPDARILELRVNALAPPNLEVIHAVATDRSSVSFQFPLLNPGDTARVSLLIAGRSDKVSASARIAGVGSVSLVDDRSQGRSVWRRLSWTGWIVAAFSLVGAWAVIALLVALGRESEIAKLWNAGVVVIQPGDTPGQYLDALKPFSPTKDEELESVVKELQGIPRDHKLSDQDRENLNRAIGSAITKVELLGPVVVAGVLTLIGIGFVISKLL